VNRGRISVEECWAKLQQIDEALVDSRYSGFECLLENRRYFEMRLEQCLKQGGMNMSDPKHEPESVGNCNGQNKGQEQADYANKALRYQDRFSQDRAPNGHNMGDTDKVKG
jgi:hypothetical protein